jgi:hypothetical protein
MYRVLLQLRPSARKFSPAAAIACHLASAAVANALMTSFPSAIGSHIAGKRERDYDFEDIDSESYRSGR